LNKSCNAGFIKKVQDANVNEVSFFVFGYCRHDANYLDLDQKTGIMKRHFTFFNASSGDST